MNLPTKSIFFSAKSQVCNTSKYTTHVTLSTQFRKDKSFYFTHHLHKTIQVRTHRLDRQKDHEIDIKVAFSK